MEIVCNWNSLAILSLLSQTNTDQKRSIRKIDILVLECVFINATWLQFCWLFKKIQSCITHLPHTNLSLPARMFWVVSLSFLCQTRKISWNISVWQEAIAAEKYIIQWTAHKLKRQFLSRKCDFCHLRSFHLYLWQNIHVKNMMKCW